MNVTLTGYALDSVGTDPRVPFAATIPAGETGSIGIVVKHRDGSAYDLTGAQLLFTAKQNGIAQISRQATITNIAQGAALVPLVVADTVGLLGALIADAWLTAADGSRYQVVLPGPLEVRSAEGAPGQPITVPPAQQPLALGPTGPRGDSNAVDVETYRSGTMTDAQTIQAALNAGVPLSFPERTYTINAGETLINTACPLMVGRNTTLRLGNGAIVNTDSDFTHHTALLRVQGLQGFRMEGSWIIDGNRDGQTYPATTSDFGRGTATLPSAGRQTNACMEFVPAADNATPCRNLRVNGVTVRNSYLNGLVFWQCEDTELRDVLAEDCTENGITGAGAIDFWGFACKLTRCGASDASPTSTTPTGFGDRAGVQFREMPAGFTAAALGMPCIPPKVSGNADANYNVNFAFCKGEQCGVESFFLRACFPGRLIECSSRNAGYKRLAGSWYSPAHFWLDMGQWEVDGFTAYQIVDNSLSGWQKPLVGYINTFSGSATNNALGPAIAIDGKFRSTARAIAGYCGLESDGVTKRNFFNKGLVVWEHTTIDGLTLEGCSNDPLTIINGYNFNTEPVRDVQIRNLNVTNALADRVVKLTKFGTVTGTVADDIVIDGMIASDIRSSLTGVDDHHFIEIDATFDAISLNNLRLANLDFDCFNAGGNFNGVRLRGPSTSENVKVSFAKCKNAFSAVRTHGFRNLEVSGTVDTCHRILLIDNGVTSTADIEAVDVSGVRTYGITDELFHVQGLGTYRIKVFRAQGCNFGGSALARTFSAASAVTLAADSYFQEFRKFFWRDNVDDYGSNAPATNIYDMRRRFSAASTLATATPFYVGELVYRTDDSSVWMGYDTRTAGAWAQLEGN